MDIMNDINSVLADDQEMAALRERRDLVITFGIWALLSLGFWLWTSVAISVIDHLALAHLLGSMVCGFIPVVYARLLFPIAEAADYVVSDATLSRLAAKNIQDQIAFNSLRKSFRSQGFLLLRQVQGFVESERLERIRQSRLSQPGAHAFLNS